MILCTFDCSHHSMINVIFINMIQKNVEIITINAKYLPVLTFFDDVFVIVLSEMNIRKTKITVINGIKDIIENEDNNPIAVGVQE